MERNVAIGYMIMAGKAIGIDKETLKKLESRIKVTMDIMTEEEAEIEYNDFI